MPAPVGQSGGVSSEVLEDSGVTDVNEDGTVDSQDVYDGYTATPPQYSLEDDLRNYDTSAEARARVDAALAYVNSLPKSGANSEYRSALMTLGLLVQSGASMSDQEDPLGDFLAKVGGEAGFIAAIKKEIQVEHSKQLAAEGDKAIADYTSGSASFEDDLANYGSDPAATRRVDAFRARYGSMTQAEKTVLAESLGFILGETSQTSSDDMDDKDFKKAENANLMFSEMMTMDGYYSDPNAVAPEDMASEDVYLAFCEGIMEGMYAANPEGMPPEYAEQLEALNATQPGSEERRDMMRRLLPQVARDLTAAMVNNKDLTQAENGAFDPKFAGLFHMKQILDHVYGVTNLSGFMDTRKTSGVDGAPTQVDQTGEYQGYSGSFNEVDHLLQQMQTNIDAWTKEVETLEASKAGKSEAEIKEIDKEIAALQEKIETEQNSYSALVANRQSMMENFRQAMKSLLDAVSSAGGQL